MVPTITALVASTAALTQLRCPEADCRACGLGRAITTEFGRTIELGWHSGPAPVCATPPVAAAAPETRSGVQSTVSKERVRDGVPRGQSCRAAPGPARGSGRPTG
jgi:hypothetical protein